MEIFMTLLSLYICHCFHSLYEQAVIRHRFTQGQIKAEEAKPCGQLCSHVVTVPQLEALEFVRDRDVYVKKL